jgi:response regulator NasT
LIDALGPLAVNHHALPAQQDVQMAIAEPATTVGLLAQLLAKLGIIVLHGPSALYRQAKIQGIPSAGHRPTFRSARTRLKPMAAAGLFSANPLARRHVALHNQSMKIVVIDESRARATIIEDGLRAFGDAEIFILSERSALIARIAEIEPDIVLIDLGNPARDVLEEYFAVSRALARPIAMFVDESDDEAIAASIDAGVSAYVVAGLSAPRIRPLLDLAVRRFQAFARLEQELAEARGQLHERETIDRAKRILMNERRWSEPEAYAELRRKAMDSNRRIAAIAEAVVTAHELMNGMR